MFGEECMSFTNTAKIDSKGRMSIPAKTGVEETDKVILFDNDEYVSIYNVFYCDRFFNNLENARFKALAELRFEEAETLKQKIEYYSSYLIERLTIDNQRRIIIPKYVINNFNYSNNVILYGEVNHVNIFKNEEQLNDYKIRVKKRSI